MIRTSKISQSRSELALPVALFAGCGYIFVWLAREMIEKETVLFDTTILLALRVPGHTGSLIGPGWLSQTMNDLTALGGSTLVILFVLCACGQLVISKKYSSAMFISATTGSGAVVMEALKASFMRARPTLVPHLQAASGYSFPSGHTMLATIFYLAVLAVLLNGTRTKALKYFYVLIAVLIILLIGTSRVFLGVHYPTDVLAGWCGGIAWVSIAYLVNAKIFRGKQQSGAHGKETL